MVRAHEPGGDAVISHALTLVGSPTDPIPIPLVVLKARPQKADPLFMAGPRFEQMPTGPPSHDQARGRRVEVAAVAGPVRRRPLEQVVMIWVGAGSTVVLAGVTGLLVTSRWSYVTLGGAFVSLAAVVIAVSSSTEPGSGSTPVP